jgi:pSer/pThr/pTyr-binding forkhead associated (FHA) protein
MVPMDVILKVIEGAKAGSKVAIKKDRFLIGRSPKCHLCAGSTAISRKHCAIMRHDAKVTITDLDSRNGTLVNGKKITEEVELSSGDELAVGPLKFMVTITHGINNAKKPEVKTVADAVERTAQKGDEGIADDDITRWLLEPGSNSKSVAETQTIHMDDTNAAQMQKLVKELEDDETSAGKVDESTVAADLGEVEEENTDDKKKSKADKKKKGPGKLPPMSTHPATKDSREAAAEALRAWNRRR